MLQLCDMFRYLKSFINLIDKVYNHRTQLPVINNKLVTKPILFRSPPLTPSLVDAIKLISPHCNLSTNQEARSYWEHDQNATCWGEDEILMKYFTHYKKPKKILEVGPGLGRSVIFLSKHYHLENSVFDLFEGNGTQTKYTINGPRYNNSFCGSISELRKVLKYNNIHNYRIFNAAKLHNKLNSLPGKYDIIYSFFAIGFHWNLKYFFDELLQIMKYNSVGFFIVPNNFRAFKKLRRIHYKIFSFSATEPDIVKNKMLVISKSYLAL